jgi:putative ABC transport system permease protein
VLILTLGIGATTAMFSVTRTVLLKPLGYRHPDRLITVGFRVPQFAKDISSIPVNAQHYQLWRDHARTIEEIGLVTPSSHILSGRGEAVQVSGVNATPNLFHVLGIQPAMGRGFAKDEDVEGRNQVVVVSHRFWQDKLGGQADAIGQKLLFDGKPFEVIGVMPAGFPFPSAGELSDAESLPEHTDYWAPLVFSKEDLGSVLGNMNFLSIARMKPGTTTQQVLSDTTALEKVISKKFPEPVEVDPVVHTVQASMAREVRLPLLILMAAVAAVLLIVCINLMNLMMVRATALRREWAIRLAVGAGLRDLLWGAFLESVIVSVSGGIFGSVLAFWLLEIVRDKAPGGLPRAGELGLDPAGFGFALVLSIGSAVLFGLWPAWRAARVDPQEALQSSGRSTSEGRKGHRAGKILVASEVALSTVLLLSACLLVRSFVTILQVNPGVEVQHMLTARINLPPNSYGQKQRSYSFYRELIEQVRSRPGVRAAGTVSDLPLTTENNDNPAAAGDRPAPPLPQWQLTNYRDASSGYFHAAGIPLKSGRLYEERDGKARVVLISENLAQRLWPGKSAVGRPMRIYGRDPVVVIGVVGAVHAASLTRPAAMMTYFPDWQNDDTDMSLVVRTTGEPSSMSAAIRRAVAKLERSAAIPEMATMSEVVAKTVAQQRFQMLLLAAFAFAALLLACLGIYGVLAFATSRRVPEIGIRMALGARPAQILRSTLQGGMAPVVIGIAAGLGCAGLLARLYQSVLFEVKSWDPVVYAATALILLTVATLACYIPSRRAARLSPIEALRNA